MTRILSVLLFLGFFSMTHLVAEEAVSSFNQGFYVGAFDGFNWAKSQTHHSNDKTKIHMQTGGMGGGVFGYKWRTLCSNSFCAVNPRIEAEISYRYNRASNVNATIHSLSYMGNCFLDVDFNLSVIPYIGFGVGYRDCWGHNARKDDHVAWQGIVGVSYPLGDKLDFTVDYRYLSEVPLRHVVLPIYSLFMLFSPHYDRIDSGVATQSIVFGMKRYF